MTSILKSVYPAIANALATKKDHGVTLVNVERKMTIFQYSGRLPAGDFVSSAIKLGLYTDSSAEDWESLRKREFVHIGDYIVAWGKSQKWPTVYCPPLVTISVFSNMLKQATSLSDYVLLASLRVETDTGEVAPPLDNWCIGVRYTDKPSRRHTLLCHLQVPLEWSWVLGVPPHSSFETFSHHVHEPNADTSITSTPVYLKSIEEFRTGKQAVLEGKVLTHGTVRINLKELSLVENVSDGGDVKKFPHLRRVCPDIVTIKKTSRLLPIMRQMYSFTADVPSVPFYNAIGRLCYDEDQNIAFFHIYLKTQQKGQQEDMLVPYGSFYVAFPTKWNPGLRNLLPRDYQSNVCLSALYNIRYCDFPDFTVRGTCAKFQIRNGVLHCWSDMHKRYYSIECCRANCSSVLTAVSGRFKSGSGGIPYTYTTNGILVLGVSPTSNYAPATSWSQLRQIMIHDSVTDLIPMSDTIIHRYANHCYLNLPGPNSEPHEISFPAHPLVSPRPLFKVQKPIGCKIECGLMGHDIVMNVHYQQEDDTELNLGSITVPKLGLPHVPHPLIQEVIKSLWTKDPSLFSIQTPYGLVQACSVDVEVPHTSILSSPRDVRIRFPSDKLAWLPDHIKVKINQATRHIKNNSKAGCRLVLNAAGICEFQGPMADELNALRGLWIEIKTSSNILIAKQNAFSNMLYQSEGQSFLCMGPEATFVDDCLLDFPFIYYLPNVADFVYQRAFQMQEMNNYRIATGTEANYATMSTNVTLSSLCPSMFPPQEEKAKSSTSLAISPIQRLKNKLKLPSGISLMTSLLNSDGAASSVEDRNYLESENAIDLMESSDSMELDDDDPGLLSLVTDDGDDDHDKPAKEDDLASSSILSIPLSSVGDNSVVTNNFLIVRSVFQHRRKRKVISVSPSVPPKERILHVLGQETPLLSATSSSPVPFNLPTTQVPRLPRGNLVTAYGMYRRWVHGMFKDPTLIPCKFLYQNEWKSIAKPSSVLSHLSWGDNYAQLGRPMVNQCPSAIQLWLVDISELSDLDDLNYTCIKRRDVEKLQQWLVKWIKGAFVEQLVCSIVVSTMFLTNKAMYDMECPNLKWKWYHGVVTGEKGALVLKGAKCEYEEEIRTTMWGCALHQCRDRLTAVKFKHSTLGAAHWILAPSDYVIEARHPPVPTFTMSKLGLNDEPTVYMFDCLLPSISLIRLAYLFSVLLGLDNQHFNGMQIDDKAMKVSCYQSSVDFIHQLLSGFKIDDLILKHVCQKMNIVSVRLPLPNMHLVLRDVSNQLCAGPNLMAVQLKKNGSQVVLVKPHRNDIKAYCIGHVLSEGHQMVMKDMVDDYISCVRNLQHDYNLKIVCVLSLLMVDTNDCDY